MQSTDQTLELRSGQRLACPACDTETIVIRVPSRPLRLACGGVALVDIAADRPKGGHTPAGDSSVLLGKRYTEEQSGLELLCTKSGIGPLTCDGEPLGFKEARPLPSSD